MSTLWPKARHVLVVPQGYQAHISDVSQAYNLASSLLDVLCDSSLESGLAVCTSSKVTVSRWVLDVCHRILKTCRSFFDAASPQSDHIFSRLLYSGFKAHSIKGISSNAGLLLDLLVEMLWTFKHYGGHELHNALDEKLHELLREDQHPQVVKASKRQLLPLLKACREDNASESADDFQVSGSLKK
jgi:hypothetical protein